MMGWPAAKRKCGRSIALVVLALLTSTAGPGRAQQASPTRESFYTAKLSCWNDSDSDYRSRFIQSPVFTSPNGKTRAYVKVVAEAKGKSKENQEVCLNRSILYISTGEGFSEVYSVVGVRQGPHGNALQLVDWSPDSEHLLIQLTTWWYESECCDFTLLLYSPANDKVRRINMNRVLAREGCTFIGWIEGFVENGDVVFMAHSSEPIGNPCVENTSRWRLNTNTLRVRRMKSGQKLRRYALTAKPIPAEPWKERIVD